MLVLTNFVIFCSGDSETKYDTDWTFKTLMHEKACSDKYEVKCGEEGCQDRKTLMPTLVAMGVLVRACGSLGALQWLALVP